MPGAVGGCVDVVTASRGTSATGGSHPHPVHPERVRAARDRLPTREDAAQSTSILSLIADPTRSRLLYALDLVSELCVGDPAPALDVNEDATRYALRLLRTPGR